MTEVSLEKFLARCREEILERCTGCGSCVANCEINRYTELKEADPADLAMALKTYIENGRFDQEAYDYAFQCINCLECMVHCPEGIEASALTVLAKARLVREGHDAPPMFKMAQPCQTYSYQNMLSALQTHPSKIWWMEHVPEDPEPHDVVLFFGCHEMIFPNAMAATRDILAGMDIDFVSVGGGKNLCCGAVHVNTGEPGVAHRMGKKMVEELERFKPSTVVLTCPTCVYYVQKSSIENDSTVAYHHLPRFLAERLDKIPFQKPVKGTFTIQDACFTGRGLGDYESPREVLAAIDNLTLVEMEHNRERALCCGATALGNNPPEVAGTFIRNRLTEARVAGADTVVNLCAGCQLAFLNYESEMKLNARMLPEIVAEAMGIKLQTDKMKQFRDLGDPSRVLKAAREAIEAGVYSEEEVAALLPLLFKKN